MSDTILYELTDGLAVITLNRPQVMNALSSAMRRDLHAALVRATGEARAIVLTGAGRGFCAGQDLADVDLSDGLKAEKLLQDEYDPIITLIAGCPQLVIAAVNGVAAGAGASLALACDVVIAAESASFLQAFAKIGLMPDAGGTYVLPRQVGLARAMGMALFAEPVKAREAVAQGLIWEAVPDADFAAHWQGRARHLATGPGVAFGAIKQSLRASLGNDLSTQLALEARLQDGCGATADLLEGIDAFLNKRKAVFQGR